MEIGFGLVEGIVLGFKFFNSDEEHNFSEIQLYFFVFMFVIKFYEQGQD
jgi:hypothetical protein